MTRTNREMVQIFFDPNFPPRQKKSLRLPPPDSIVLFFPSSSNFCPFSSLIFFSWSPPSSFCSFNQSRLGPTRNPNPSLACQTSDFMLSSASSFWDLCNFNWECLNLFQTQVSFLHTMRKLDPDAKATACHRCKYREADPMAFQWAETKAWITKCRCGWHGTEAAGFEATKTNGFEPSDVHWAAIGAGLNLWGLSNCTSLHDGNHMYDFAASSWETWYNISAGEVLSISIAATSILKSTDCIFRSLMNAWFFSLPWMMRKALEAE